MKLSSKMERCGLSPMRKFNPLAEEARARGIRIYHMNIGQPDVETPAPFFDALRSFAEPVVAYAPAPGIPVLLDAVRGYYRGIGVELARDDILPTFGGSEALQMTLAAILDDGDEIVIPEPFYPNYHTPVILAGAKIRPVPTSVEEGYFFADRARIEACINERTRALFITNPGNPTGSVLTPAQLGLMLDIAKEHGLFLICDEVYREFVYAGEPLLSALQYPGYEDNVIVIDSVSKRFSACGARVGMVISKNREFMGQVMKWCQCRLAAATVDQIASAALYRMDPGYFDAVRDEYRRRRDVCVKKLQEIPGCVCLEPKGAFYIMCALPIDDADRFQAWMLQEFNDHGETMMFAPGEPFYATPGRGRNEIRLAYTINCADIERAIDILKAGVEAYNRK
ncbi:MAG: pyridoxal phosphate-dependent aminotransferase [Oscillospiraceae bacterium]|nr:pyridoxal phosphate-dependent aminotransferase [Oscillospiraceae bacterium]